MLNDWSSSFESYAASQVTDEVLDTFLGRGVSEEQVKRFRLGYCGIPPHDFPELAAWFEGHRLSDALVFPLTTFSGRIKGFQFRSRGVKRYLEYKIFEYGPDLFGAREAASSVYADRKVIVVEGAFDLFPVARLDPSVVSTLTAKVSHPFFRSVSRVINNLVILYDNDETGKRATDEAKRRYGKELTVSSIPLPKVPYDGPKWVKDVGELWEVWGDSQLHPYLRSKLV